MGWCSLCYVSLSEGLVEKRNKSDLPRKGEGRNFWGTNNDPNLNLGWAKKCMDPNCTLTCFFAPRIWSNESEKSGQVRWCHSKSYTVVLQRLLVGGSQANQLHPFLHRKSHHHKFSQKVFFPSTVPLKNLILSCVIFFSESFCFTFAIVFFLSMVSTPWCACQAWIEGPLLFFFCMYWCDSVSKLMEFT